MGIFREKLVRFIVHPCVKSGVVLIALVGMAQQVMGQVIPSAESTPTEVILTDVDDRTHVNVIGGQPSSDGANLFHEFEQFDIDLGQSVRFVTTPDIQNVLSIVTGGPSTIDGLLQVLGSQSDLYLINSAGILFGPNAQLNLPGSLSVTTATGIGFDEDQWLRVLETPSQAIDYSRLVGRPTAFDFSGGVTNSGAVINLGDLALGTGQSLSLMGSTVINTGNLTVPAGTITLTAVDGTQRVRIGQDDRLLSLEVSLPMSAQSDDDLANGERSAIATLGELLTGGAIQAADTLVENADGTVSLVSSGTVIPEQRGAAVVLGQLSVAAETGGEINLFGSQVALFESTLSAAGTQSGGTLRLGGDAQGSRRAPTARRTYIGREVILNADATEQGDGGQVYVWSDEATDFYGFLSARGGEQGGNGGFGEISGKIGLSYGGEIDLSATQGIAGTLLFDPQNIVIKNGIDINAPAIPTLPNLSVTGGALSNYFELHEETLEAIAPGTNIVLQAENDVILEDLADNVLRLQPGNSLRIQADSDDRSQGSFLMNTGDTIWAPGGTVSISTGKGQRESLVVGTIDTQPLAGQIASGDIILSSRNFVQAGPLNAGEGVVEISGNSIDFIGGENSVLAQGVTLQQGDLNSDIVIGSQNGVPDALNLSIADIAALDDNIGSINIGRTNNAGSVTLLAAVADSTGNGFRSPVRIQGTGLSVTGPDLDTVWTIDWSPSGEPINTLSNYSELSLGAIDEMLGGNRNDTINFLDRSAQMPSLIDGGAGNLTLAGDDLNIPEGIQGTGNLFVRTLSSDISIELGGDRDLSGGNTLSLFTEELSRISDAAFASVTIGDVNSGPIVVRDDLIINSALTLRSGDRIDTTAGTLMTTGQSPLNILATGDIIADQVIAVGGDIGLVSSDGNISATSVNASGTSPGNGEGGDMEIAADGYVQITGHINDDVDAPSLATNPGNAINIAHGGNGIIPFRVGTASLNGTVGEISNGVSSISNAVLSASYRIGDINISTLEVEALAPPLPDVSDDLLRTLQIDRHLDSDDSVASSGLGVPIINIDERTSQEVFSQIESAASAQFEQFLSMGDHRVPAKVATLQTVQDTLAAAQKNLAVRPALIYVYFVPDAAENAIKDNAEQTNAIWQESRPTDQLEVMLISPQGTPIRRRQWGVTRAEVDAVAKTLRYEATRQFSRPADYLPPAQQLYRWMLQPLEAEINALKVDNLAFILDDGLRTIPLAVLHDGEQFLVENYSLGLMPTFSLTDLVTTADDSFMRSQSEVLAMGASRFLAQPPLPAVEAELDLISRELWQGEVFLNERFTLKNLKTELGRDRYNILHLATHAVFNADDWNNSYIQLWNERVTLNELNELDLKSSDIGLIILSACNTALGDPVSEYGFAGFAVNAGSESALASLWPVSDEGTLGFMTQFYQQLSAGRLRADSLRAAQVSMLRGEVSIVDGQVKGPNGEVLAVIPELVESGNWDFSHPFYWSAFTMIGNPW